MIIMFLMILLSTMASCAITIWAAYLMAQFGGGNNKKIRLDKGVMTK